MQLLSNEKRPADLSSLPLRIFPSLQGDPEYEQGSVHYVQRLTNEM